MKFTKNILNYFAFFLTIFSPLIGKQDYQVENQPVAIEVAQTLSNEGILKQKDNGFVYLDVSNAFIDKIIPLLEYPGELRKRPTAARSMGAHISVFEEKEDIHPDELDSNFSFNVQEIRSFTMHTRDGLKKLWVIAVNSPELEQLREKYGCSPKLKGHDFHITLAKQMPSCAKDSENIESFSAFNFSDEPTLGLSSQGDFVTVENQEVLDTVAKVNQIGQLHLKGNGFVYLDVNNQLIDEVVSQLPIQNEFEPVSTKPKKMGAHISVIYEDEMIGHEIWDLREAGEWFEFEVKELRYVDIKSVKGNTRLWLLAADAPALERLRTSYGLKPKLQGHDFHITIGKEQLTSSSSSLSPIIEDQDLDASEEEAA